MFKLQMPCKIIWAVVITTFIIGSLTSAVKIPSQQTELKRSKSHEEIKRKLVKGQTGDPENNKWKGRQDMGDGSGSSTTINPLSILTSRITNGLGSAGSSAIIALAGLPVLKGFAKASLLALPFQIKEMLIRPLILVALLLFLLTGAAYFACNVVNCQSLIGGLGDLGGSAGGLPFGGSIGHKNDKDLQLLYEQTLRPIMKSLENGYQKYK